MPQPMAFTNSRDQQTNKTDLWVRPMAQTNRYNQQLQPVAPNKGPDQQSPSPNNLGLPQIQNLQPFQGLETLHFLLLLSLVHVVLFFVQHQQNFQIKSSLFCYSIQLKSAANIVFNQSFSPVFKTNTRWQVNISDKVLLSIESEYFK